jgi:hypothetical protein
MVYLKNDKMYHMRYLAKGKRHTIQLGNMTIKVDSLLEGRVLTWLHEHGFTFERGKTGVSRGDKRYTQDIWLSVEHGGLTHKAMIEIKPKKSFFTKYIYRRMIAAGKRYTDLFLLYADKEKQWYIINPKKYELTKLDKLVPGKIPINKLYKPLTIRSKTIGSHKYRQAIEPIRWGATLLINLTADLISATFNPPKRKRHRRKKR